MNTHHCELCGSPVRIVSDPSGDGTNHYDSIALSVQARWRQVIVTVQKWRENPSFGASAFPVNNNVLLAIDAELIRLRAIAQAAQEYVYRENVCRLAFEGRATADTLVQCQVKMRQASEALAHVTLLGPNP